VSIPAKEIDERERRRRSPLAAGIRRRARAPGHRHGELSFILATLAAEAGLDDRIGPFVGFYVLILAVVAPILASRSRTFGRLLPRWVFAGSAIPEVG
jgi:hypothetical protein